MNQKQAARNAENRKEILQPAPTRGDDDSQNVIRFTIGCKLEIHFNSD